MTRRASRLVVGKRKREAQKLERKLAKEGDRRTWQEKVEDRERAGQRSTH
jgi:hypothetical protein